MPNAAAVQVTTPTDTDVVITRVFDAPRRLVWEAWTRPEHLTRWLLGPEGWTLPICEVDVRPGGSWRFGWRKASGSTMEMSGSYREVVPPERLVHTEKWGPEWPETINTLTLVEKDGKTTATQTIHYPTKRDRDAALATGMLDGASVSYDRLDEVLRTLATR